jgi:hypothetical protein
VRDYPIVNCKTLEDVADLFREEREWHDDYRKEMDRLNQNIRNAEAEKKILGAITRGYEAYEWVDEFYRLAKEMA